MNLTVSWQSAEKNDMMQRRKYYIKALDIKI
jgi:hypothetical protein